MLEDGYNEMSEESGATCLHVGLQGHNTVANAYDAGSVVGPLGARWTARADFSDKSDRYLRMLMRRQLQVLLLTLISPHDAAIRLVDCGLSGCPG